MIKRVECYGLGAIGSNLLLQLAKQQSDLEYVGFDFDKVEPRNIGPQAYFLEHVGQPKTIVMAAVLKRFQRNPKYKPVNGKVETPLVTVPEDTLVLDCFDNTKSRRLLTAAKGHVFHVGFSPYYTAEGIWSPDYDAPEDIQAGAPDLCTLPDATSFIHFVVNAAALTVLDFLLKGVKRSFIATPNSGGRIPTIRYL